MKHLLQSQERTNNVRGLTSTESQISTQSVQPLPWDHFIELLENRLQFWLRRLIPLTPQIQSPTPDKPAASSTKRRRWTLELIILPEDDEDENGWRAEICETYSRHQPYLNISTVTKWPHTNPFSIFIIIMNHGSCFYLSLTNMTHSFLLLLPSSYSSSPWWPERHCRQQTESTASGFSDFRLLSNTQHHNARWV